MKAVNKLITNKEEIIGNIEQVRKQLADTDELEKERERLDTDLAFLTEKSQMLIEENAKEAYDQKEYERKYDDLAGRYDDAKEKYDKICADIKYRTAKGRQIDSFIHELKGQELIKEFDPGLWCSLVDFVTVNGKGDIRVTFKDGTEIKAW